MAQTGNNERLPSLQSLKGMAALMVFFSHALGMCRSEYISAFRGTCLNFFVDGQCAVVLFLCLTGFFTYKEKELNVPSYKTQVLKKAIRIYTPYILVTIIAWIIANLDIAYEASCFSDWCNTFWQNPISFSYLIKALLLVVPFDPIILNSPVWYIQVDMRMAFVIPFIVYLLYSIGRLRLIVLSAIIIACAVVKPPLGLMFYTYYGGAFFENCFHT